MTSRSIIIDTDPGHDDAVAILAALASPELQVRGVTTVAGNVPLALTTLNARRVLALAGREDVPVFAGCDRPLLRPLVTAEEVHGHTGLDGADLPEPQAPLPDRHAVDWLIETLLAARDDPVTVCPLGPLTNIALTLIREPRTVAGIREIVLMGGAAFEGGNTTPAAEFNIYVDPHAADVVFRSGLPLTMLPLDCTHKALMPADWIESLRGLGNRVGNTVASLLTFYQRYDVAKYGSTGGPLHDPTVIAYLLDPELFAGKRCNVRIETTSPLTMGMTVTDWWGVTGEPANCMVMNQVDAGAFFAFLSDCLGRF